MAPSAAPFEPSYTALKSLCQKISNYTMTFITLPHRPENLSTDLHPYLDNAIVTLSTSTAHLYDDNASQAVRVVEVKKGVEKVNTKLDDVKTTFKTQVNEVKAQVDEVDKKVAEIKTEMRSLGERQDRLESQIDNIRSGVNNGMAIQLNSLRKWLDDPIQPISASVQIEDRPRYIVAAEFPITV